MSNRDDEAEEVSDAEVAHEELEAGDDDQQNIAALKRHAGQLRGLLGNPNPMTKRDCETVRKLKRVSEDIDPSTRALRDILRRVDAMAEGLDAHVIELVALVKSVERKMEAK